ncbi:Hypothetical predicted protein [Cloeon dipterum]|uniref:Cyclin-C n=1 Tax=Cloeon dipterum TaxID=197152 RepID=A0A8S1D712_9INSE|nr:Hypothetical predicted protein [Cloeon dipterum]
MAAGLLIASVVVFVVATATPETPASSVVRISTLERGLLFAEPSTTETPCDNSQYEDENGTCLDCKSHREECDNTYECCPNRTNLECKNRDKEKRCYCKNDMIYDDGKCMKDYSSKLQFMTAAQVALGVALVISVAALTALTCKMCSNRRRMEQVAQEFHRGSINNASLNSVQRFVLGRLRDRPPRYDDVPDKPPEYEQEPVAELSTLPMPRIPAVAASRIRGQRFRLPPAAPPAYAEVEPAASSSASVDTQPEPASSVVDPPDNAGPAETVADNDEQHKLQPVDEPVSSISPHSPDDQQGGVDNPAFSLENECHMKIAFNTSVEIFPSKRRSPILQIKPLQREKKAMAGNFWHSSHYQQWLLDKQDLTRERQHDLSILADDEYQKIFIFFANFIQVLGEHLKLRQQVIATATVYFKRFYARNSLKSIDPLLLAPTCVFLSSKVEEFGVISNTRLITTCQNVVKNKFGHAYSQEFPYRTNHILECEFYLLENLDCCLIVYQPYRPLLLFTSDAQLDDGLLALAWRVVNDSLRTDACLFYPPYIIALGCLHIACVIQGKDLKTWFAELNVDLEKVHEVMRLIAALMDLWKGYDEKKEIQALLAKMPKPKQQPTR